MGVICKVNNTQVQTPTSIDYELTPVVTDENRLEDATLTLRPVAHKYKAVWTYDYILGASLITMLGESWEKYVDDKTYRFRVSMPSYKGGQLEFDAYFKAVTFKLVLWNSDPNLRVYSNFSMTWIEY